MFSTNHAPCARGVHHEHERASSCRQTRSPEPCRVQHPKHHLQHQAATASTVPRHNERPQQQKPQVTALTTEALQSRDNHARDDQRQTDSCNTPDTPSDRQMASSQTSTHSSIMDVDATNDPPRQQRAPLRLPSSLDIQDDTMQGQHTTRPAVSDGSPSPPMDHMESL